MVSSELSFFLEIGGCEVLIDIDGIKFVVTEEFPDATMEPIGSRLYGGIDHGSPSASELCTEVAGLYLEFLNCVRRWQVCVRRPVQEIHCIIIVVDPIEQIVVVDRR